MTESRWGSIRDAATGVATRVRAGSPADPISTGAPGVELAQLVGPDGKVIGSSPKARGAPALGADRPPADDPIALTQRCTRSGDCLFTAAVRVRPSPDSPIVYVAERVPQPVATGLLDRLLGVQAAGIAALAAWTAHRLRLNGRRRDGKIEEHVRLRRFASDVSHELRNPLTALRLRIEEAGRDGGRACRDGLLGQVLRDVTRLESIIEDLRLLSVGPVGPAAGAGGGRLDLTALVAEEVALYRTRMPAGLRLELGVFAYDVSVRGVRTQICRMLTNLLGNAQRHANSTVTVELRRDGTWAELAVADDGNGISPADRERVFERFVRLAESRRRDPGGTGLGLAICREIARAHGGTVHVEDAPGGGARLVVRLPLDPGRPGADRRCAAAAAPPANPSAPATTPGPSEARWPAE